MDWERFLKGAGYGLLDGPAPPELNLSDDNYQRWVLHVLEAFVRNGPGIEYKLDEDERQWAERAVAEGTFVWAPAFQYGLLPVGDKWPTVAPTPPAPPALDDAWLGGVLKYLSGKPGRVYDVSPAETELALAAIAARRLEWEIEGISIRLPRPAGGGPYR
jgi:hypothetical protein